MTTNELTLELKPASLHPRRPQFWTTYRFALSTSLVCVIMLSTQVSRAQGPDREFSVMNTVHNLSVSGPGEIKSKTESEICKFCHIPHTAVVPAALWGHALSEEENYKVPEVSRGRGTAGPAPQPDGSSRLCLSCHDGTVALGDVKGEEKRIRMQGSQQRLRPERPGFIGTDLTGSHPVSFEFPDSDPGDGAPGRDIGLRPLESVRKDERVRLDSRGKVQCTSCHDPHADRYYEEGKIPRFWVKPTVDEVCLTCHELQ